MDEMLAKSRQGVDSNAIRSLLHPLHPYENILFLQRIDIGQVLEGHELVEDEFFPAILRTRGASSGAIPVRKATGEKSFEKIASSDKLPIWRLDPKPIKRALMNCEVKANR